MEHYLADEPVAAHRESLFEQASRFGRRHSTWIQAGGLILLLAVLGLLGGTWITSSVRRSQRVAGLVQSVQSAELASLPSLRSS